VDEDGIEEADDQVDLFVEVLFADRLKLFLAANGPFRLSDCTLTGEVVRNGFERDAAVAGDRPCRAKQRVGVDTLAGELDVST
jgi:hypothetical protein